MKLTGGMTLRNGLQKLKHPSGKVRSEMAREGPSQGAFCSPRGLSEAEERRFARPGACQGSHLGEKEGSICRLSNPNNEMWLNSPWKRILSFVS